MNETAPTTSSSSSIFHNYPLISAILAFTIAQSIKFFTVWFVQFIPIPIQLLLFSFFLNINQLCNIICRYKEKRWDPKQLVGSGGMPSSHSATVTALATAVGFHEGFGGPLFATALVMAIIV